MKYLVEPEILGDSTLKLDGDDSKELYLLDSPPAADQSLKTKTDTIVNQCEREKNGL